MMAMMAKAKSSIPVHLEPISEHMANPPWKGERKQPIPESCLVQPLQNQERKHQPQSPKSETPRPALLLVDDVDWGASPLRASGPHIKKENIDHIVGGVWTKGSIVNAKACGS